MFSLGKPIGRPKRGHRPFANEWNPSGKRGALSRRRKGVAVTGRKVAWTIGLNAMETQVFPGIELAAEKAERPESKNAIPTFGRMHVGKK